MGKNMYVYDYDGHRVKIKKNRNKHKEKEESFSLPPVDGAENNEENGGEMSSRNSTISSLTSRETMSGPSSRIATASKHSRQLVLGAMLSRRYSGFDGGDVYLPSIRSKASSMYSSRSEPGWYDKERRLMYERNNKFDRSFMRATRLRKQSPADMVLTFYRTFGSPEPELRVLVSEQQFRNLNQFIDELARVIDLRDQECYIHSPSGHTVRHLGELQDGGIYFFGPRYMQPHDYHRFRGIATPDLLDAEPVFREDRKNRQLRIIPGADRSQPPYKFLLDASRHKSLRHVLQDLDDLMMLEQGHVQKLCTRNGKQVQNLGQLFHGVDDIYVALSWNANYPFYNNTPGLDLAQSYPAVPYRQPYGARHGPYYDYHEPLQLRPYDVLINNRKRIFEPPHIDQFDGTLRKFDIPPFDRLDVEWVYGYNGKNCRNNLYVLPSEEALYFVAKIVVIYDVGMRYQRHYLEHTEEIRCISQHPNQWIFASGQVAGSSLGEMGHVRIWDAKSLITLNVLDLDETDLSVECMAFSQGDNGMKLATISTSGQEWTTHVWDWEDKTIFSKSDPYIEIELACMFDPSDNRKLVSCGKNHVYFWNVSGKLATYTDGEFVNHHISEYVTCLGFNNKHELITADSNAFVHVWDSYKKRTTSIIKTTHTGSIITMTVLSDGYVITGGGSDRMLTLINYYQMIPTLHQSQIDKQNGGIVAIVPLHSGYMGMELANMSLLIGTSMNNVMLGSITREFETLVEGTSDQMTAVASHPVDHSFLTAGVDCSIILWSASQHSPVWDLRLNEPCSAAVFFPNGDLVAIGITNGRCVVFRISDSSKVAELECKNDRSSVTCISYSNNGSLVAIGTEAGGVHIYYCLDDGRSYRYMSSIKSWAERIISIDWNMTETHLRFVTASYNFEIWDAGRCCEERNRTTLRNLQFVNDTSPVGYYTAGVWSGVDKDLVFTSSEKSGDNVLFCAATNQGSLRLYNYPCDGKLAPFSEVNVHSGSVSRVSFLANEHGAISSGESDYCVVQWKFNNRELSNEEIGRPPYGYIGYGRPLHPARRQSKYNPNLIQAP